MSERDSAGERPPVQAADPSRPAVETRRATHLPPFGQTPEVPKGPPHESPPRSRTATTRRSPGAGVRRTRKRLAVKAAPFWRRVLADVFDLVIVAGLAFGAYLLGIGAPDALPPQRFDWIDYTAELMAEHSEIFVPPLALLIGIGVVYAVISRTLMTATPGERLFGLRLIDREGAPCSPFRALFHAVGTVVGLLLGLVGYGWAAVDLSRQGLAEYVSGTLLIHGPPTRD